MFQWWVHYMNDPHVLKQLRYLFGELTNHRHRLHCMKSTRSTRPICSPQLKNRSCIDIKFSIRASQCLILNIIEQVNELFLAWSHVIQAQTHLISPEGSYSFWVEIHCFYNTNLLIWQINNSNLAV